MSDIPLPPPFGLSNIVLAAAEAHPISTEFDKLFVDFLRKYSEDLNVSPALMELNKSNKAIVPLCNHILASYPDTQEYESSPMQVTDAMGREKFWEDAGRP
jgi:hypothetical protein